MANKYFSRSRRSDLEAELIISFFSIDFPAAKTVEKTGLNKEIIDTHYFKIRKAILNYERRRFALELKKLPIDTSLFLSNSLSGKISKNLRERFHIVNILLNNGQLVSDVFCNSSFETDWRVQGDLIKSVANNQIFSFEFADSKFKNCTLSGDGLKKRIHRNDKSIKIFTQYTQSRLKKFNGHAPHKFIFHLKESQWRFNNSKLNKWRRAMDSKKLYEKLLEMLEANPS